MAVEMCCWLEQATIIIVIETAYESLRSQVNKWYLLYDQLLRVGSCKQQNYY